MKTKTKFKIIGYVLLIIFVILFLFSSKIPFFKDEQRFKFFFPIAAVSFLFLAYAEHIEYKESTLYNYNGIIFLKNIAMYVFFAAMLIIFTIII